MVALIGIVAGAFIMIMVGRFALAVYLHRREERAYVALFPEIVEIRSERRRRIASRRAQSVRARA